MKPSNILIDREDKPHIADFGLAIREDLQDLRTGEIAGTPPYMSPEQVRGETHRLDGRTDVWALGVILYRGLVGRQPFSGRDRAEIFDEIFESRPEAASADQRPDPPRARADLPEMPVEADGRSLRDGRRPGRRPEDAGWSRRSSTDTFATAAARGQAAARPPATAPARIVPKGLRAFDIEDADFFPTLVPGPRDRDGLPESIRAWKRRIEERDPARTFAVGLLYGPSGSGKSSLVKAGLIPRLARTCAGDLCRSHAERDRGRPLAALRPRISRVCPPAARLDEAAAAIRERAARPARVEDPARDRPVRAVAAKPSRPDRRRPGPGPAPLRRSGLQALLLVRDDFWMAITRFLRALEVRLVEGVNSAPVELFDPAARQPRAGRARACPGPASRRPTRRRQRSTGGSSSRPSRSWRARRPRHPRSADALRRDAPVPRLDDATLRELGGIEGIGVMFLEETFSAHTAPPAHRFHQRAAQAVLKALLPDPART